MDRTDLAGVEQALWIIRDALLEIKDALRSKNIPHSKKEESLDKPEDLCEISRFKHVEIDFTCLSVRAGNCLRTADIKTVGDLIQMKPNQFLELKMVGVKIRNEFILYLKHRHGLIYGWNGEIICWHCIEERKPNDN